MFQYIYKPTAFFEVVNSVNKLDFLHQGRLRRGRYFTGTMEQADNERRNTMIYKAFSPSHASGTLQNKRNKSRYTL